MVLSSCAGTSAAGPRASSLAPAPAPTVSADAGSIAGVVTDDELQPLVGAMVGVLDHADLSAQTDKDGKFTLNQVEPGSYKVVAQKLGYESAAKSVSVEAGKVADLKLTLAAMAIEAPRQESSMYDGFIDGDVYTSNVGLYYPRSFPVNMTPGATEIVVSAQWDATVPVFARYLYESPAYGDAKNSTWGRSPLTTNITDFKVEKSKDHATVTWGVAFACGGSPTCLASNPDAILPQIAYQQHVHFYINVFYYQHAPPGFTGLP